MNNEIWKPIEEFPGYEVSNTGRVRSLDRDITYMRDGKEQVMHRKGKELSQRKIGGNSIYNNNNRQYLCVAPKQKPVYVHRIVAEAFCEKPDCPCEVNHINGIKTDNRAENLEWITHLENVRKITKEYEHSEYWYSKKGTMNV